MRIVFMGTPDFSVGTLEAMVNAGHEVCLVLTQPDKPKGRGKELLMTPVKEKAIELGIPVEQPVKVRTDEELKARLRSLNADVFVVVAFGQILPKDVLDIPKYGCINVHASLLPKYRGSAPLQWVILNGEKVGGVTTMMMDEGVDTGDMLLKEEIVLDAKETYGSYHDKMAVAGAKLLVDTLKAIEDGTLTRTPQNGETCHAPKIDKSLGLIDFNNTAEFIERYIRGLNPYPSAFAYLDGKVVKLWDADIIDTPTDFAGDGTAVGAVIAVTKDSFTVKCGTGSLVIKELQIEGKKRMDAGSFLRGYKLEEGAVLTNER